MDGVGFPEEARRLGLTQGSVLVQFTLDAENQIRDFIVVRTSHRVFSKLAYELVSKLTCQGPGYDIKILWPVSYRLAEDSLP